MGASVSYRGETIVEIDNETKVLNTAGTWLEGDLTITEESSGGGTTLDSDGIYAVGEGDTVTVGTGYNGRIEVAKKITLTNNWDFTQGLTDSVGGLSATLGNGATQSSSGVTIGDITQFISFPFGFQGHKTYEVDIASINRQGTAHGRLFMVDGQNGFIYRNNNKWDIYLDGVWDDGGFAVADHPLDGKTIRIVSGEKIPVHSANGDTNYWTFIVYVNGALFYFSRRITREPPNSSITIGAGGNSLYNMVVTGFRVYDGVAY